MLLIKLIYFSFHLLVALQIMQLVGDIIRLIISEKGGKFPPITALNPWVEVSFIRYEIHWNVQVSSKQKRNRLR